MSKYQARAIDSELDELFGPLTALALEGPKGVGKTATATRRAKTVVRLDEAAQQQIAGVDPVRLLEGPGPILLDEWQHAREVWNAVKRAVDDGVPPGPFLLAGSAVPQDEDDDPGRHSGAGRIDLLRMRPMTLPERLQSKTTVSLAALLGGERPEIDGASELGLEDYTDEVIRSGFPGIRKLKDRPLKTRLRGYIDRVIDRDFKNELDETVRRPEALRRWMAAYAAASAGTTSFEKIRDAATHNGSTPAKETASAYRDALLRLFILDPIPGWTPSLSHLKRLTQREKHHLCDPALAVSLLGLSKKKLLSGEGGHDALPRDGAFLGALFESLATLSVRVFAQAADADVYHLRQQDGRHEVDLIVESEAGDVVALEVKLSATVDDRDVRHLVWLREKIGARLQDAVVVTTGAHAYRRQDGVCVIPLALLGP